MGDLDQCPGLLDLGDVSQDLEALSPLNTDRDRAIRTTELSEDSAAEHEYDNISSPGGSSTCSGPTYKRHLGFGPTESARPFPSANVIKVEDVIVSPPSPLKHAVSQPSISSLPSRHRLSSQTSLEPRPKESRKKKKKTLLSPSYDENSLEQSTQILENDNKPNTKTGKFGVSRSRHKKEPLPMKMRALPQSFWQQPNNANPLSPGAVYSRLPPLPGQAVHEEDILDHVPALTEVAGEEAEQMMETRPRPEHRVTEANTDLLFSLFNGVEEEDSQRKIHLVRRGRPRKPPPVFSRTRMLQDEDPCLVSTMTESILPLIPERAGPSLQNNNNKIGGGGNVGTQVIKIMSISAGDKSVDLPSLNIEHNYPHLLSELVMKL